MTDRLFLNYSWQFQECACQQRQQEKHSQSYKLSKLHSQILRHSHLADLDSTLHLSLHQIAAFPDPWTKLRPCHDVDAVSYLASLACNDKARFIFNIFPENMIPAGVEVLGFHIKVRAVQGHSSLPRNYDPSALGELLDLKKCVILGNIFHASSNVNYDSINAHGLVLSPFFHGLGHEKGRVGARFVYAGGVTHPRHGTVIRKGRDIHYWNLDCRKFLQDGFQLRGTPNGVALATSDVPGSYLEPSTSHRLSTTAIKFLVSHLCRRLQLVSGRQTRPPTR